ncbi:MAG TPA: SDR family NAD(P)-dependent oxidoreductase, partial [Rhodothermales bacterium]|nr:SDR family NAD(P)-dependent oxidoreductase [Rhodothermales bacterium]
MSRVRDRHVLITGAASGMGRLMAHQLAREGARLSLVDIDVARLYSVAAELPGCTFYLCDITSRNEIADLRARVHGVDILINNAGVIGHGAYVDVDHL